MKDSICTVIGLIGGTIAALFGGWDTALQTLVIFMAIDYITGLVVAGVFHASPKTKTGTGKQGGLEGPHPQGRDAAHRAGGLPA